MFVGATAGGAAPGSELGKLGALSLWWGISLPHGLSPAEGAEENVNVRLGEFPTILPLDRFCASGKDGIQSIFPGAQSIQRVPGEVWV